MCSGRGNFWMFEGWKLGPRMNRMDRDKKEEIL